MTDEQILKAMQTMLEPIKEDLSSLKQDVSGLKQDVSGLKQDVSGLKQDVSSLKQDMMEVKQRVTKIELKQENEICPNIQLLVEGHENLAAQLKELEPMKKTLADVKADTEVLKVVVTQHSQNIHKLELVR